MTPIEHNFKCTNGKYSQTIPEKLTPSRSQVHHLFTPKCVQGNDCSESFCKIQANYNRSKLRNRQANKRKYVKIQGTRYVLEYIKYTRT